MAAWVIPTVAYVFLLGSLGIVSKLALEWVGWPTLIFWTTIGYIATTGVLLLRGEIDLSGGPGAGWAIATAALAISGLVMLYVALGTGDASKVVPIAAAYPIVTVALAAVLLSEPVSPLRYIGTVVVVLGIAMISVAR